MNVAAPISIAYPDARTRILDAAESIVLARGVSALTLDAAAKFAGVSKGGLLYHFASKEALLRGLVDRIVGEIETDWDRSLAAAPPGPRRACRAALQWTFHCPPEEEAKVMRRGAVLLAAHHHDPAMIEPIRAFHARLRRAVEAEAPPGVGLTLVAASDGLFIAQLFNIWRPQPEQAEAIESALSRLIETA